MKRFLHLDFKGIIPAEDYFKRFLEFFRECGFNGIVFEYDFRIKWDCWKGCSRNEIPKETIRELLDHAHRLGFETLPLIQTLGHLEWALVKEQYSHLREAEYIDELCPLNPDSAIQIRRFIDEVLEMHPAEYIHLGGDEAWYLGSCKVCKAAAERDSERGKLGAYMDYISEICRYVSSKGVRPMIWADMFAGENAAILAKALPEGTILVDWEYGTIQNLEKLQDWGLEIWGASACRCGEFEHWWRLQNNPEQRISNVAAWNKTGLNVIHTTWGRPRSLWSLYPPWFAVVPVFIAAGSPEKWAAHPWRSFVEKMGSAVVRNEPGELIQLEKECANLPVGNMIEQESRDYLKYALQYQRYEKECRYLIYRRRAISQTNRFLDMDEPAFQVHSVEPEKQVRQRILEWESNMQEFFRRNHLSDAEEFLAEKMSVFEGL